MDSIKDLPLVNLLITVTSNAKTNILSMDNSGPTIIVDDLKYISDEHNQALFTNRSVKFAKWLSANHLSVSLGIKEESEWIYEEYYNPIQVISLRNIKCIGFSLNRNL